MNAHCRIGRVKYKNGLSVLPSLPQRRAADAFRHFDHLGKWVHEHYAETLAGYVVVVFEYDGSYSCQVHTEAAQPVRNSLPTWVAEVLRRDAAEVDCGRIVRRTLGIE